MKLLVLVLVVACGGSSSVKTAMTPSATTSLIGAVAQKDVATLQKLMAEPFQYAGVWFSDPSCMQKFPTPRVIDAKNRDAFIQCLLTLPLRASNRTDPLFGVAVATYDPGLEIEISFAFMPDPVIRWIGYAGRHDLGDGLPSVVPEALVRSDTPKALDNTAALTAEVEELDPKTKAVTAWFKICIDGEGNVTGVHPREASSPRLRDTYRALIPTWKFQPFKLGGQPTPVCTLEGFMFAEPDSKAQLQPELPLPDFTNGDEGILHVEMGAAKRLSGVTAIAPYSDDKLRIGSGRIDAVIGVCTDEQGAVVKTVLLAPSGYPNWDAHLLQEARHWRYQPFVVGGKAFKVCTGIHFLYHQG